jgi:hypothetical protein
MSGAAEMPCTTIEAAITVNTHEISSTAAP